jgi:hypothetical protein
MVKCLPNCIRTEKVFKPTFSAGYFYRCPAFFIMLSAIQIINFFKTKDTITPEKIKVYRVLHLLTNEHYNIAVLSAVAQKDIQLFILNDEKDIRIEQSAIVHQPPMYNKPEGLKKMEEETNTTGTMVWQPCRISYSPFYPFWKIKAGNEIVFFDTNNKKYSKEDISDAMHG